MNLLFKEKIASLIVGLFLFVFAEVMIKNVNFIGLSTYYQIPKYAI